MSLPKTQKVSLFEATGDYDQIKYVDYPTPQIIGPTDLIIKNKYAGVNFIEGYFRKGIYPSEPPYVFGREASGVVAAVGEKVSNYKVGDNVAYFGNATFAQYTKIDANKPQVFKLPANASDETFQRYSSILTQGLTALTFINESYNVQKGDFILVWAAAGGVGQFLVQLVSQRGARVIAVASTDEKLKIAEDLGAEFTIKSSDDVVAKVHEITGGAGVAASFDGIGKDTFEASFASVARKGTLVSYGNASGVVPPLSINRLSAKNLKILRPQVFGYIATQEEWDHYSKQLFDAMESGDLKVEISKVYPLSEYKQAAIDIEGRKTTGKLLLRIPE